VVISLACASCSRNSTPAAPETAAAIPSTLPPLAAETASPPAPTGGGPTPSGGQGAPAAPTAIDFATANRPIDANGRALSDLEWLNRIVQNHLMQSALPDAALPQGKFNSPTEEFAAYSAAMERKQKAGVLRDLSDLVRAGVIKAIPAAPPGKQYVLDAKSGSVVLADRK